MAAGFAWRRTLIRAGIIVCGALLVGALALIFRTLSAGGTFTEVTPGFAGRCTALARVPVSGIAYDAASGLTLIAANPPGARDGALYRYDPANPAQPLHRLSGVPEVFHPAALALAKGPDGALTLLIANHRGPALGSIDIFALDGAGGGAALQVREVTSLASSLFADARAIAPAAGGRFYVATAPVQATDFMALLKGYVTGGAGRLIYYDGQMPRVVATGLRLPRGLAVSPDGGKLYVGEAGARGLEVFPLDPFTGKLQEASVYALPLAPSHVLFDAAGALWVSGDPKLFARQAFARGARSGAPSQILRVSLKNGEPGDVERIFTDPGRTISAAGAFAVIGQHLLIGSILDNKLVGCAAR